jgi:hypothetical protein
MLLNLWRVLRCCYDVWHCSRHYNGWIWRCYGALHMKYEVWCYAAMTYGIAMLLRRMALHCCFDVWHCDAAMAYGIALHCCYKYGIAMLLRRMALQCCYKYGIVMLLWRMALRCFSMLHARGLDRVWIWHNVSMALHATHCRTLLFGSGKQCIEYWILSRDSKYDEH